MGLAPDDPLAAALLQEMNEMGMSSDVKEKKEKEQRAEHKFKKKGPKLKGRQKHKGAGEDTSAGGQGFLMGKRGGIMPAHIQATVRSAVTDEA